MEAIDLRKESIYKAKPAPAFVDVPEMLFVMVDGKGAAETPENNPAFQEAMEILFGIVYTIKFWDKKYSPPPGYAKFTITPVEGLWWMNDGKKFDMARPKDWRWTVMIRLPDFVTPKFFKEVVDEIISRKQKDIYKRARLERFNEGMCAQLLYIGPYDQEQTDINKMHGYIKQAGFQLTGKHHELYFSDPRRTPPEKLKTILRQPVAKGGTK